MIRGYLTRRANGLYLLTHEPPVLAPVGRTQRLDAYAAPGDAMAFNNLCEWSARAIWGIEHLSPLASRRVWLKGGIEEAINFSQGDHPP